MPSHLARPAIAFIMLAAGVVGACSTTALEAPAAAAVQTEAPAQSPPGPDAKAAFEATCSECHDISYATQMRNSRAGWAQVIDRMGSYGMTANDTQKAMIISYLAAAHGPE